MQTVVMIVQNMLDAIVMLLCLKYWQQIDTSEAHFSNPLKEYMLYTEAIKVRPCIEILRNYGRYYCILIL